MFYSPIALLVFFAALLLSLLLYIGEIKSRVVFIAGLCSVLVFLFSLVYILFMFAEGSDDPSVMVCKLATAILMNLYACVFNAAARVWERFSHSTSRNAQRRGVFPKTMGRLTSRQSYHTAEAERIRATGRI